MRNLQLEIALRIGPRYTDALRSPERRGAEMASIIGKH